MVKAKKKSTRTSRHRASWKGPLSFGLVSFPVEAYNALDREHSDIHFHQVHAECHRRIQYQKVCPVHGEVPSSEIVSTYEYSKGKFIEVEREELNALRTEKERALKIDAFISPQAIDPLYFDGRMYYLAPQNAAAKEPYAVIVEAMEREERYGIGTVVFSGKDQIVLVRPVDGVLHMAMLNYEAEIRPPSQAVGAIRKPAGIGRQVRMAQTLVREWSEDNLDFSKYEDTHREKVKELIAAKKRGDPIEPAEEEDEEPDVVNLMDALKKSLNQVRGKKRRSA